MKKLTIVEKILKYISKKMDKKATLQEIYNEFPEHTAASIRGNINRHIQKEKSQIKRLQKGVYGITKEIQVTKETIKVTNTFKVLNFEIRKSTQVYQNNLGLTPCLKMVSGENIISSQFKQLLLDDFLQDRQNNDYLSKRCLSLTGATRKDLGKEREDFDFYPTPPDAIIDLLRRENFEGSLFEPACGDGAISKELKKYYPNSQVYSTDLIDRGYGDQTGIDFLKYNGEKFDNIVTNPPYGILTDFINKALDVARKKVAMLVRIQSLEGVSRFKSLYSKKMLETIYVFSRRVSMYANGIKNGASGVASYVWLIFNKDYNGLPCIKWIAEDNIKKIEKESILGNETSFCAPKNAILNLKNLGIEVDESDEITNSAFLTTNSYRKNTVFAPPFGQINVFLKKALETTQEKICLLAKIESLTTITRYQEFFSKGILKNVFVFTRRLLKGDTKCYAWLIFDKNYHGYPQLNWI